MSLEWFRVLEKYGFREGGFEARPLGRGLINQTWRISDSRGVFVLQKINEKVFPDPEAIAGNLHLIGKYLQQYQPGYYFPGPVLSVSGEEMVYLEGSGYYRLFPYVSGSITHEVVPNPRIAYEAARAFGRFTRLLEGLDMTRLKVTLPGFHELGLRHSQFEEAVAMGNPGRIRDCENLIAGARDLAHLVDRYEAIRKDPSFRQRVTHHDTKISNVLFNERGEALCVIDLDTVMPGYFISDLGDMMRTYLSTVSEEEKDFSRIDVREEYRAAVLEGYLAEMKEVLTPAEIDAIPFAGPYIIYMQALRFLTDHLNNDRYYGAKYEGHNKIRAENQLVLLGKLL